MTAAGRTLAPWQTSRRFPVLGPGGRPIRRRRVTRGRSARRRDGSFAAAATAADEIARAYGISRSLARSMVRVADKIGAKPYDLANLINFESGWNAQAINPRSGASGLIQFMPRTAEGLGTSVEAIRRMTAAQQMPYVERYLQTYAHKGLHTAERLYMAVFYPKAIDWPRGQQFNAAVQKSNPGIKTPTDYVRLANRRAKLPIGGGGGRGSLVASGGSRSAFWVAGPLVSILILGGGLAVLHRRQMARRRRAAEMPGYY